MELNKSAILVAIIRSFLSFYDKMTTILVLLIVNKCTTER